MPAHRQLSIYYHLLEIRILSKFICHYAQNRILYKYKNDIAIHVHFLCKKKFNDQIFDNVTA